MSVASSPQITPGPEPAPTPAPGPAPTTVMRTLIFGVRTSARTSALLMRTLRVYSCAADVILNAARRHWRDIRQEAQYNGRLSARSLEKVLRDRYGARITTASYPMHSSLVEALFSDVAAALVSYHELTQDYVTTKRRVLERAETAGLTLEPPDPKLVRQLDELGDAPSWPTVPRVRPDKVAYDRALDELCQAGPDSGPLRTRFSQALAWGVRPLFFPRPDGAARNRNFALLRSEGKAVVPTPRTRGRRRRVQRITYRGLVYLLPGGDGRSRPLALPPAADGWEPFRPLQGEPDGLSRSRLAELAPHLLGPERLQEVAGEALGADLVARIVADGLTPAEGRALQEAGLPPLALSRLLAHERAILRLLAEGVTKETAERLVREGVPAEEAEALRRADQGRQHVRVLTQHGLTRSRRASAALLLPLECGKWHELTLDAALERPAMIRAARLIHRPTRTTAGGSKRPEKFFLAVTFEHQVPPRRTPTTHLGISMDEDARVGWCVRNPETGEIVASGTDERLWGVQRRWRERRRALMAAAKLPPRQHHRQRDQVRYTLHQICNSLLDLADHYNSQIAINDVRYLRQRRVVPPRDPTTGKRLRRSREWHEAKAEAAYSRACLVVGDLERILTYKGPQRGLPKPLSIGGISQRDCAHCGQRSEEVLLCTHCGDVLGAANSARITAERLPLALERISKARARRQQEREQRESAAQNNGAGTGDDDD